MGTIAAKRFACASIVAVIPAVIDTSCGTGQVHGVARGVKQRRAGVCQSPSDSKGDRGRRKL